MFEFMPTYKQLNYIRNEIQFNDMVNAEECIDMLRYRGESVLDLWQNQVEVSNVFLTIFD